MMSVGRFTIHEASNFRYITRNQLPQSHVHVFYGICHSDAPLHIHSQVPLHGHLQVNPTVSCDVLYHLEHCLNIAQAENLKVVIFGLPSDKDLNTRFVIDRIYICSENDGVLTPVRKYGTAHMSTDGSTVLFVKVNDEHSHKAWEGKYIILTNGELFYKLKRVTDMRAPESLSGSPATVDYNDYYGKNSFPGFRGCSPMFYKNAVNCTDAVRHYLEETQDTVGSDTYKFFWGML